MSGRTLPAAGSLSANDLRALPEGSLVVTYGVGWAKVGPDEWDCPFAVFKKRRDSAWLSHVATLVVFNPAEWGL